jgi:hypothetical protein
MIASELEGVLYLDNLPTERDEQNQPVAAVGQGGLDRNMSAAILAGQHELKRDMTQLRTEMVTMGVNQMRFQETMNKNVSRLARQPGRHFRGDNQQPTNATDNGVHDAGEAMALNARLTRTPRTLYLLWEEYTVGLGGFKAARLFTAQERGRSKCCYCKRKVVWEKIAEMIRAGYTAETAIDKIYKVYGENQPVTKILKAMVRDRKNGGHPQLHI